MEGGGKGTVGMGGGGGKGTVGMGGGDRSDVFLISIPF